MKFTKNLIPVFVLAATLFSCSKESNYVEIEKEIEQVKVGEKKATLHDFKPYDPNEEPDGGVYDSGVENGGGSAFEDEKIQFAGTCTSGNVSGVLLHNGDNYRFSFTYTRNANGTYTASNVTATAPSKASSSTFTVKKVQFISGLLQLSLVGNYKVTTKDYTNIPDQEDDEEDYEYYSGNGSTGTNVTKTVNFSVTRRFDVCQKKTY